MARRVQELEIKRQKESLEVSQKIAHQIPAEMLRIGLIWQGNSATKFRKLLEWLEELKLMLETGNPEGAPGIIGCIYGSIPTVRSVAIESGFKALADMKARKSAEAQGDGEVVESADLARPLETTVGREVLAEICSITQQYQLFIREHVEITPTMREECLAPTAEQRWLMRQMNSIDRQIERKTRLLLEVQQPRSRPARARRRKWLGPKVGEEKSKE